MPLKLIGTNDGLSQGMINDMLIDQKGYLWVATKEGLNRYDGYHFKVFRHNPNNPNTIADNMVNRLYLDKQNRIWIELDQDRIDCFDPKTERFIHLNSDSFINIYLNCPNPKKIQNTLSGNLVVPSLDGFDTIVAPKQPTDFLKATLAYRGLSKLYRLLTSSREKHPISRPFLYLSNGDIWLTSYDSAFLIKNNGTTDTIIHAYNLNLDGKPYHYTRIITSQDQKEVYALRRDLILHFDTKANRFVPILRVPQMIDSNVRLPLVVLYMDKQNAIWCIGPKGGCLKIDVPHKTVNWIKTNDNLEKILSFRTSALVDPNGNMWFGTAGFGILKIPAMASVFKQFQDNDTTELNEFWLERTIKPGNKAEFDEYAKRRWQDLMARKHLANPNSSPSTLVLDNDGYFWRTSHEITNNNSIIDKYSAKTFEKTRVVTAPPISNVWYGTPLFLSNNNEVWFGSRPINDTVWLHHINQNTGQVDRYLFPVKAIANTYRFILDWYQQKDGLFWFGTIQGLFSFNPTTHAWQHFANQPGKPSTLSINMVYSIWPDPVDPDRYLWVGTNGGGLNKMDKTTGTFTAYTTDDGLPNNVIYGILNDSHHNLWLSTNNGLCLFNPKTLSTHNFTQDDGLPGNEFNRYLFSKSADGELYFGGVSGTVHFNPEDYYTRINRSEVVINQLKIFNKPVGLLSDSLDDGEAPLSLKKPIEYLHRLVLNYDQRMVTFGFSVLDFSNPQNNQFKYKLDGYQNDWIDGGNNPEATFTNLSPGSYTLEVLGRNSYGVWNTTPTSLSIKILPPWWGTWWFKLMAVLLFMATLYLLYRYRLRQAVKMEKLRNRIAQDLHDEIGSTLSSISLYTSVVQTTSSGQLSEKTNKILDKIADSATSMMESMNDIVWTVSANNDSFDQVVYRMRAFAASMAECTNVALSFEAEEHTENLKLTMLQRKNIYLIYKEAVNNAMKHGACTKIAVSITHSANQLIIKVQDNGKGFEMGEQNKYNLGGNGLLGMKARAKETKAQLEIQSEIGKGTTMLLVLPI